MRLQSIHHYIDHQFKDRFEINVLRYKKSVINSSHTSVAHKTQLSGIRFKVFLG